MHTPIETAQELQGFRFVSSRTMPARIAEYAFVLRHRITQRELWLLTKLAEAGGADDVLDHVEIGETLGDALTVATERGRLTLLRDLFIRADLLGRHTRPVRDELDRWQRELDDECDWLRATLADSDPR